MKARAPVARSFEAAMLPEDQKEDLCRSLLAEFGATRIQATHRGELIHGCLVGQHSNQDREPTASLNYQKLVYNCLGCGAHGGLLWFIATCRGEDTDQSRTWLAKTAGLDGEVMDLTDLLNYLDALYAPSSPASPPIPRYSLKTLDRWNFIHPYMTEIRGVPEETLERFRVGYAEKYFVGKGDRGESVYSERITLPHVWKGDLVGWQSRRLVEDGTPKYLNSPDFPKDTTLYNYDPRARFAVAVESGASVLRHDHHQHLEGTFGAKVTDFQVSLLAKHETVVLWMDNDAAGWDAVEGSQDSPGMAERLSRYCNVMVVQNPYAADPGDLDDDTVDDLIERAVPYSIWKRPEVLLCHRCKDTAHPDRRC